MIYQFIPVAPVRVMERLIRSMGPGTMAVLDLEDGYLDVRDSGKTGERRARGRKQLLELCANAKGRTIGRPVAMRVNVAGSGILRVTCPWFVRLQKHLDWLR